MPKRKSAFMVVAAAIRSAPLAILLYGVLLLGLAGVVFFAYGLQRDVDLYEAEAKTLYQRIELAVKDRVPINDFCRVPDIQCDPNPKLIKGDLTRISIKSTSPRLIKSKAIITDILVRKGRVTGADIIRVRIFPERITFGEAS